MGDMLAHDGERVKILLERHLLHTGSKKAAALLENWAQEMSRFVKVMPNDYRRALLDMRAARRASVAAE